MLIQLAHVPEVTFQKLCLRDKGMQNISIVLLNHNLLNENNGLICQRVETCDDQP